MSTLWPRFTEKLKESGYTLNDLVYCSEDLFLTIVEDMNAFTPLQIASLAKEWQRTLAAASSTTATAPAPAGVAVAAARARPSTTLRPAATTAAADATRLSSSPAPSRTHLLGATPQGQSSMAARTTATPSTSTPPAAQSTLSSVLRENAFAPPRRSPARIKEEAEYLLTKLSAQSGEEYQVSPTEGIVAVEASPEAWSPLVDRVARMQQLALRTAPSRRDGSAAPAVELQLLWKLCSPPTLRKMEMACVSGAPFGLSNQDDVDGLCSSAVVVYDRDATRLTTPAGQLTQLFADGWALVAFDVAVGRARTVTREEAHDLNSNLHRFSMEQCLEMLEDAGFDAFHVPSRNAVAVCHMHQMMPRFVVFVSTLAPVAVSRRLGESAPAAAAAVVVPDRPSRAAPALAPVAKSTPFASMATPTAALVPVQQPAAAAPTSATTTIAPRAAAEADLQCVVHRSKTVEFWSPTEKRLLCSHCLYYDGYSQENCIPMEQAAREEAPRLERWVQNAVTFSQEIQAVFDLFEAAQTDVAQTEERVRGDIAQSFTRLRSRLDAHEATLLQQCQQQAQQSRQALQDTVSRVAATVQFVKEAVQDADGPVAAYRGGVADTATCVAVLRSAQRAFGAWEPVAIQPYADLALVDGAALLQPVEAALKAVQAAVTMEPGKVQLPEAIDVNFLKADCEV